MTRDERDRRRLLRGIMAKYGNRSFDAFLSGTDHLVERATDWRRMVALKQARLDELSQLELPITEPTLDDLALHVYWAIRCDVKLPGWGDEDATTPKPTRACRCGALEWAWYKPESKWVCTECGSYPRSPSPRLPGGSTE